MRVESLIEFRELAHHLNYTVTSEKLHMSQPNLSNHIQELEKELGFTLFNRGKELQLTVAGKKYLSTVCNILYQHELAVTQCREIQEKNLVPVRIMKPPMGDEARILLLRSVRKYNSVYSEQGGGCHFVDARSKIAVEALAEDLVDVAVTIGGGDNAPIEEEARKSGIALERVLTVPLLVWMNVSNPLNSLENVTINDLSNAEVMMSPANHRFDPLRFATRCLFEKPPHWEIIEAVNEEDFYANANLDFMTFVTPSFSKKSYFGVYDDVILRSIADDSAKMDYYLAWNENETREYVIELIDMIEQTALVMQDEINADPEFGGRTWMGDEEDVS